MKRRMIDLSLGNPIFMQRYWLSDTKIVAPFAVMPGCVMSYQTEQLRALTQTIGDLHNKVGNATVQNKRIVIGNGATQLLCASMWAARKKYGVKTVYAQAPYWFRMPSMAHSVGMKFSKKQVKNSVEIVTYPSNPENVVRPTHNSKFKIHDMCYHWPQYIETVPWDFDVMIFGMAKATGHAASRIGWAVVKDLDTADLMEEFIETTTGGVGMEAQYRATQTLASQFMAIAQLQPSVFAFASVVLTSRWRMIENAAQGRFKILNNSGMFMWCKRNAGDGSLWLYENFDILSLSGVECGADKRYFRINIGCSDEDFAELHARLTEFPK